jgi:ATP-dependent Lon protease
MVYGNIADNGLCVYRAFSSTSHPYLYWARTFIALNRGFTETKKRIVVVAQKEGYFRNPEVDEFCLNGNDCPVLKIFNMPDGSKSAIVQGLERAKIQSFIQVEHYFKGASSKHRKYYQPGIEIDDAG